MAHRDPADAWHMIRNYRQARQDAAILIDWARGQGQTAYNERYLEALSVMNGHDAIKLLALVMLTGLSMVRLPDDPAEVVGVPETGA